MRVSARLALAVVLTSALALAPATAFGNTSHPYESESLGATSAYSVDAQGGLLAVGCSEHAYGGGWSGFMLYSLLDPSSPQKLVEEPLVGRIWDVLLDGDVLYVAGDSLLVYDVSTPSSPVLLDSGTIASPFTLALSGSSLFVGRWSSEVVSVDVSDPSTPVELDTVTVAGNVNALEIDGSLMACAGRNNGALTLIDVTDPSAMLVTFTGAGNVMDVGFTSAGLVSFETTAVKTWTVTDPSAPVLEATFDSAEAIWTGGVDADTAYLGGYSRSLTPLDVTSFSQPSRLPDYLTTDQAQDIERHGDYLYVACADDGLLVARVVAGGAPLFTEEMAGDDRYETAIAASQHAFPHGAGTVIVATGENWPDALGGSALAGAVRGPILLTPSGYLRGDVLTEIRRLKAGKAIILGSEAAVGGKVEASLKGELGDAAVDRIGGDTRYETADLTAREVASVMGGPFQDMVFIATGMNYADAASASSVAAARRMPILLVPDAGLPSSTRQTLIDLGVDKAIMLGSDAAVTAAVAADLAAMPTITSTVRLEGADRYATAVKIAEWGVQAARMTWNGLGLATGEAFPDALAGGVVQGRTDSALLLTKTASLPKVTSSKLLAVGDLVGAARFFGGTPAVSQSVRDQAVLRLSE